MGEKGKLFAVKHLNTNYTAHKNDGNKYYYQTLCFEPPNFLFTGNAGILDVDYWLRDIKKNKEHPLVLGTHLPFVYIPFINHTDVESRQGNFITLNCNLVERAYENGNNLLIGANDQPTLFSMWGYVSGLCSEEGFDLSRDDWENYKVWSEGKLKKMLK